MKVRYTAASPKAGQVEHLPPHIGNTLVAAGFAEAVPLPSRNDPGWLDARNEQAALAVPQPGDVDPNAKGTEWGIRERTSSDGFSHARIIMRRGSETFYFDAPPADCPASIKARFQQLLDTEKSLDTPYSRERAQQAQYAREQQERVAVAGVLHSPKEKPSVKFI